MISSAELHRRRFASALAIFALAASALVTAAPSARADSANLSVPSTAWVSQPVTIQVSNVVSSGGQVTVFANNAAIGTQSVGALGNPTLSFSYTTPANPGNVSIYAQLPDGTSTPTATLTVSSVPTTTVVSSPNTAQVGVPTQINVTVTSSSPSQYTPTGNVVVRDANGGTIITMGLAPGSINGPVPGQAYAYWRWTPPSTGTYFFIATFQPAGGTFANGSTSAQDSIIATPSGGTISIQAPPTMNQGVPVTLRATVAPASTQGSVGFTVNGAPISASIPLVNGVATFQWTPTTAGQITLGANYTTNQGGSGSTSEVVTVIAGPAQFDSITLVQPGFGPWAPNGTYTLGNGSNFTFQASSLSGSPVTLSETGPCAISGLTISVPTGSGACNLKASTNGGNGYGPITFGYTVNLIPGTQTATLAAPASRTVRAGRVLVLESPQQQDTNAGQNIQWTVRKNSRSVCRLLYPSSGAVTLRMLQRGTCTVTGRAPGVPGQWNPFQTARTYTVR